MTNFEIIKRSRLSGPGLRVFMKIADLWGMDEVQRIASLGDPDRSTYREWMVRARANEAVTLPQDTLTRISAILGIHKALEYLFSDHAQALDWLKSPNRGAVFQCTSPLYLIIQGSQDGVIAVLRYLDERCGGNGGHGASDINSTPVSSTSSQSKAEKIRVQ
jgi:hypothetical protein